jgi:hypothetical protein
MSILDRILKLLKLTRIQSTALVVQQATSPNGRWEQVRLAGSEIVRSYRYTCRCGQTQPLTIAEANDGKDRACLCNKKFNLLRDIGALDCNVSEAQSALASLPVHALAVPQPRRPAALPLEYPSEPLVYTGGAKAENESRQRSFDAGDPGFMGPGF